MVVLLESICFHMVQRAVPLGVLETGRVKVGEELILEPISTQVGNDITLRVRSIQLARGLNEPVRKNEDEVSARAIVSIATGDVDIGKMKEYLKHGGVLGRLDDRPMVVKEFEARVVFFKASTVYAGKEYFLQANVGRTSATISDIGSRQKLIDLGTGEEYEVTDGEVVTVRVQLARSICIESDDRFRRLTRFVLRQDNEIVACGRCVGP